MKWKTINKCHKRKIKVSNCLLMFHSKPWYFSLSKLKLTIFHSFVLFNYRLDDLNTAVTPISAYQTSATGVRQYVHAPFGLYPMPISHSAKQMQISRVKSKFKFLGKFMAKAIMDSRMVCRL